MPTPGADVFVVDEPLGADAATATDTLYLLSPDGPATPTRALRADTTSDTLNDQLRTYFSDGGKSVVLQGFEETPTTLPSLADALALLPAGPGQLVAPDVVTSAEMITLAGAWAQNKVAILNPPANATDADLATLAAAVIAGADARGAALFADTGVWPGQAAGATVQVPWSVTVAALIAQNDRLTGNPNIAAAGKQGISAALGLVAERTPAAIQTLKGEQVNAAKTVSGQVRNYGFRTLADLTTLPQWWDFSGSRLIMAVRAQAAAIDEDFLFSQIDGQRQVLDRYQSRLESMLKDYYDLGALYGATPEEAYSVDTSDAVNTVEELAAGEISAQIRVKTSPFAEHLTTNITRRPLTAAL